MDSQKNILSGEMGFDSSLYDSLDKQMSNEEYKSYLITLLQPVLDQRFPNNPGKRKIEPPRRDRITFACPYCGDSQKSDYKRRGNFILEGKHSGYYKCHNCGVFKRINNFFKDYNVDLNLEAINYLSDHTGDFNQYSSAKYDMSILLDMEQLDSYAIDRQELLRHFGLVEIKDSPVRSWLINRLQFKHEKFLYSSSKNYVLILNLTQSGKILGAQKRNFKGSARFETYRLSKLYEAMEKPLIINDEQKEYLDTLSMIFNICLIDFSKPITLFEGPMDSFLFRNSIANTGANKELPIDIPVRYFYDNDETGRTKAMEHISKGHEVFLWDKFMKVFKLPYRHKWDWNDALQWADKENIKFPFIDNYFSGDPLDAIDI